LLLLVGKHWNTRCVSSERWKNEQVVTWCWKISEWPLCRAQDTGHRSLIQFFPVDGRSSNWWSHTSPNIARWYVSWGWQKEGKKKKRYIIEFISFGSFEWAGLLYICWFILFFRFTSIYRPIYHDFSFLFSHHLRRHENERIAILTSDSPWTAHSYSIFIHIRIVLNDIGYTIVFHTASRNHPSLMDHYLLHMADGNVQSLSDK
jgi:hypothetical protein